MKFIKTYFSYSSWHPFVFGSKNDPSPWVQDRHLPQETFMTYIRGGLGEDHSDLPAASIFS